MTLAAGTRLGPYEILAFLGAGGMGKVYRARDTRLHREVAIKVAAERFSERFEREARAIASLNHTNICHLYDVGPNYLVMELVEGETLSGPLKLDEAMPIIRQLIDGIEAAHEKNIVHRDLKPSNIKITPEGVVKILDFGLAKATAPEPEGDSENSPTLTMGATVAGTILGTAAYMAPEQARGKTADRRADIWSFGVVVYELLTGKRAFEGESVVETLGAVINREPDWTPVPPRAQRLLKWCLEKDRKQRLQAIGDARRVLEEAPVETPAPGPEGTPSRLGSAGWIAAAVAVAIAAFFGFGYYRASRPVEKPLVRLNLDLPSSTFALSSDGARIVYLQPSSNGPPMLATRLLAESGATILPGTENAAYPFFSPDGQWIGFVANGQLQKISVRGGAPVPLATAAAFFGTTWGSGSIIASFNVNTPLLRIPDTGGPPEEIVSLAETGHAATLEFPQYLPGGKAILFTAASGEAPGMYVKNLATRKTQRLLEDVRIAHYLPTGQSTGHIAYVDQGTLFARPFDPTGLAFLGPPQPVLSDVATDSVSGAALISFSETGNFLYQIGQARQLPWPVQWMEGSGTTRPLLNTEGAYWEPSFSPDLAGQFLALVKGTAPLGEVLVYDWKNDVTVNLTGPGKPGGFPVWSPDGRHLAMTSGKSIVWIRSDGSGEPYQILASKNRIYPSSISPDGRYLAGYEVNPATLIDVWVAPLDLSNPDEPVVGKPQLVMGTPATESAPVFSPDGKWLAYSSDESGRYEIYVRPFPGPGAARKISVDGGLWSAWSSNGHELFFQGTTGGLMVVDYRVSGDAFLAGRPRVWSNARIRQVSVFQSWALHPDGKRIAMFPPEAASPETAGGPRFGYLENFFDEVRRRAPAGK